MQLELTKDQIRALLEVAPKNDVRFYLNGACLDADRQLAVATDGHILIAFRVAIEGSGQAIVHTDTLSKVAKSFGRCKEPARVETGEGEVTFHVNRDRISASLTEGTFPDYTRVIPVETCGELAQFNPELLARLARAFAKLGGTACPVEVQHNGNGPALVAHSRVEGAIGVCMPFRPNGLDHAERVRTLFPEAEQKAA